MPHLIAQAAPLALKYVYGSVVHYRPGDKLATRVLSDFELVLMIEGTAKFVNACKNEQQVSAFSRNRIKTGFGFLNDTFLFHPLHFDASVRFGFGSDQRHKIKLFRSFLLEMKFSV